MFDINTYYNSIFDAAGEEKRNALKHWLDEVNPEPLSGEQSIYGKENRIYGQFMEAIRKIHYYEEEKKRKMAKSNNICDF